MSSVETRPTRNPTSKVRPATPRERAAPHAVEVAAVTAGARLPKYKGLAGHPSARRNRRPLASRPARPAGLRRRRLGREGRGAGWTRDELYAAPPLWARVDLTGVALLVGDNEVVAVTPNEIRIRTASGATQAFYQPARLRSRLQLPAQAARGQRRPRGGSATGSRRDNPRVSAPLQRRPRGREASGGLHHRGEREDHDRSQER